MRWLWGRTVAVLLSLVVVKAVCPRHKSREAAAVVQQEAGKSVTSHGYFKCGVCGKMFRTDGYLDQHLDRRHPVATDVGRSCYADYCPFLGCGDDDANSAASGNPRLRRVVCDGVMLKCFPGSAPAVVQLRERLRQTFCLTQFDPAATSGPSTVALLFMVLGGLAIGVVYLAWAVLAIQKPNSRDLDYSRRPCRCWKRRKVAID